MAVKNPALVALNEENARRTVSAPIPAPVWNRRVKVKTATVNQTRTFWVPFSIVYLKSPLKIATEGFRAIDRWGLAHRSAPHFRPKPLLCLRGLNPAG